MGLTVVMEFIPQTEDIRTGDVVVTSGLERNIPPGLVIGKVTEVNNKSNEVWQSVNIEPLVDLDELTIVAVVIDEEGGGDD
jgi:rod shape-determining protein MreC